MTKDSNVDLKRKKVSEKKVVKRSIGGLLQLILTHLIRKAACIKKAF